MKAAKEEIVLMYSYIKEKLGLKIENLKNSDKLIEPFFKLLEESNLTDPEIAEANLADNFMEALSQEWLFLYISFNFQNDINYKTYKAGLENKKFDWIFYLSGFCTKKALFIYENRKPQWKFFVERDLFKKYKFDYSSYLKDIKGEEVVKESPFINKIKSTTMVPLGKMTITELLHIENKERNRYLNTEAGFYHCITEEIYYTVESEVCNQCNFKEECLKRVW